MKKVLTYAFLLVIGFLCCASTAEKSAFPIGAEKLLLSMNNHVIPEYFTEHTAAVKKSDGTVHLYIFSQPVAISENGEMKFVDISLKKSENPQYLYQGNACHTDIYFPKILTARSGIRLEKDLEIGLSVQEPWEAFGKKKTALNFIDQKTEMLVYQKERGAPHCLKAYLSRLGLEIEYGYSGETPAQIQFWLKLNSKRAQLVQDEAGYLSVMDNAGRILGILQQPLQKDEQGNVYTGACFQDIEKVDDIYLLTVATDASAASGQGVVYFSFEPRTVKQPDTQVYSENQDLNTYLKNISILGIDGKFGEGRCYTRFYDICNQGLKKEQILSASYHIYNFSGAETKLEVYQVAQDWCSLTANWKTAAAFGDLISVNDVKAHSEASIDITSAVQNWVENTSGELQDKGILITSQYPSRCVFSSTDCALYTNYTEIVIRNSS